MSTRRLSDLSFCSRIARASSLPLRQKKKPLKCYYWYFLLPVPYGYSKKKKKKGIVSKDPINKKTDQNSCSMNKEGKLTNTGSKEAAGERTAKMNSFFNLNGSEPISMIFNIVGCSFMLNTQPAISFDYYELITNFTPTKRKKKDCLQILEVEHSNKYGVIQKKV